MADNTEDVKCLVQENNVKRMKTVKRKQPLDPELVVSKLQAMLKWEWISSIDFTAPLEKEWCELAGGRRPKQGEEEHTHTCADT